MSNYNYPGAKKHTPATPHPAVIRPIDKSPQYKSINTPIVDMRPAIRRLNIVTKEQPRGNCAAHAFIFLHEYLYGSRLLSDVRDLSEEYAEYVTFTLEKPTMLGGENFWALDIGYQKWGLCAETQVPTQTTPVTNIASEILESGKKWIRLSPDFIKNWDPSNGATDTQLEAAIAYLDQNIPVAIGLLWPVEWGTEIIKGVDLMKVPSRDKVFDGHAVDLVGYGRHSSFPGGGYFIFRNSWGKFGENEEGYGYMPFEYVKNYANDLLAYTLTNIKFNIGSIKSANWEHGTIVQTEYPDRLTAIERKGWGTSFKAKAGMTNWFHIPISTPVILDGIRPQLTKVFCLYQAGNELMMTRPKITNLHVYDGKKKVKSFDGLDLDGDHSNKIDELNMWHISPPLTILSGMGVSIHVVFPSGPNNEYEILFSTIGADFNNS